MAPRQVPRQVPRLALRLASVWFPVRLPVRFPVWFPVWLSVADNLLIIRDMIVCPSADLNTSIVCDVSHCQILMCHDIVEGPLPISTYCRMGNFS